MEEALVVGLEVEGDSAVVLDQGEALE